MTNQQLSIRYLIDILNTSTQLNVNKRKYLIDSYPILKLNSNLNYYNLLCALLIASKNINYKIDNMTFKISINEQIISDHFIHIDSFIRTSSIDPTHKKKYINYINTHNNILDDTIPTNDSILLLTLYFGINLLIYNTQTQTIKYYYYDNIVNINLPYIIIKESKEQQTININYELIFSQNKFIFEHNHPIIAELIKDAFIVGLEPNKKLEYEELNNVKTLLTEIKHTNSPIILNILPNKYEKLIIKFQNSNLKLM